MVAPAECGDFGALCEPLSLFFKYFGALCEPLSLFFKYFGALCEPFSLFFKSHLAAGCVQELKKES